MWLWLSVLIPLQLSLAAPVSKKKPPVTPIPATALGPTSEEESHVAWDEGHKSFEDKDWNEAVRLLSRYVDRYPGFPNYLQAHFELGAAYLGKGDYTKAIEPLRYTLAQTPDLTQRLLTRVLLGKARLALKQFHEAYLLALEIEKASELNKPAEASDNALLVGRGLLLKAEALKGLKYKERAARALTAAQSSWETLRLPTPDSGLARVSFEMKTDLCALLPSSRRMTEALALSQLERRGDCLLEALPEFENALSAKPLAPLLALSEVQETDQISFLAETVWKNYWKVCSNPPASPKSMNSKENKQYIAELRLETEKRCKARFQTAREMLEEFLKNKGSAIPEGRQAIAKGLLGGALIPKSAASE